jgi:alpha-beta hydrolase superfamily lysophospholipase
MTSMTRSTDTVVLIHGLWMTPLAWEHWVTGYQEQGFSVLTPGYPGIEPGTAGVAALREDASALDWALTPKPGVLDSGTGRPQ